MASPPYPCFFGQACEGERSKRECEVSKSDVEIAGNKQQVDDA
jgi:hypothetical protein